MSRREEALAAARAWLGTPYLHQASVRGLGCDCLGLLRGIWRDLYGAEPEPVPPYRPDWAETATGEPLLTALDRWFDPVVPGAARPGDVLVFRVVPGACAKHCAVLSAEAPGLKMIHAYWGHGVTESWMAPWWRARLVAAFAWPGVAPERS